MRKIVLLLITMFTLYGCGDDVQFNTPALQAKKDYKLWRANYYDAVLADNGRLTINAGNATEKMTFMLSSLRVGTYGLSDKSVSKIDFLDFERIVYSTSHTPDHENDFFPEAGSLTISEIDGNTITGTFRFVAYTADGLNAVGFNEGVFYKVPVR